VNNTIFKIFLDVQVTSLDNNSSRYNRSKSFELSSGIILYADAEAASLALVAALAAITEGDITQYVFRFVFKALTAPPSVVGNVYKVAVLTLDSADSSKKLSHDIFSPYDAMVSGKEVVTTAALQTYLDFFETGGDFTMSDGDVISTNEATRILTKKIRMDSLSSR